MLDHPISHILFIPSIAVEIAVHVKNRIAILTGAAALDNASATKMIYRSSLALAVHYATSTYKSTHIYVNARMVEVSLQNPIWT